MISSTEITHPGLGLVHITFRTGSHTYSARWRDGKLHMNVPRSASQQQIFDALAKLSPRLQKLRPSLVYVPGQQIRLPDLSIAIRSQSVAPRQILATARIPLSSIEVGQQWDFADPATTAAISDMACRIARKLAPDLLLPRAREIAARVGRSPGAWTISRGHRVLGHCDSNGVIALSYAILFLPLDLRDYIVCHELAHLSEMNHGPRFHKLCDAYCGGREAALIKKLKTFSWPILRK